MTRIVLAVMALLFCLDARADCGPRDAATRVLKEKYAEVPMYEGLSKHGHRLVVFASKDGKTWTVLVVRPDGTACVADDGERWEVFPEARGRAL